MDGITREEFTMGYFADIAKDQNNIFLSTTMTGNLQLLRLEHIGYFRYNSRSNQWEAVLSTYFNVETEYEFSENFELSSSFYSG